MFKEVLYVHGYDTVGSIENLRRSEWLKSKSEWLKSKSEWLKSKSESLSQTFYEDPHIKDPREEEVLLIKV